MKQIVCALCVAATGLIWVACRLAEVSVNEKWPATGREGKLAISSFRTRKTRPSALSMNVYRV